MKRVLKEVTQPGLVHPALIPGIGVEQTGKTFSTNRLVFAVAGVLIVNVITWAFISPDAISHIGSVSLAWVTERFGWLFGLLAIAIAVYMLVVHLHHHLLRDLGRIGLHRHGVDEPER